MDLSQIMQIANDNARQKGFWNQGIDIPKKLMLIVSEISEAMESDRIDSQANWNDYHESIRSSSTFKKAFEDNIKDTFGDELADALIRICDLAMQLDIPLNKHVEFKMQYNSQRSFMHGGKKY